MTIVKELEVCTDCYMLIANGDASALDYHYGDKADERLAEITAGMDALTGDGKYLVPWGAEKFSWRGCDCCHNDLSGHRHATAVLK